MSNDNPFAPSNEGGYAPANVGFGAPAPGRSPIKSDGLSPAAAPTGDLIKDTTTAGFQEDVLAESRNQPVLIDFWAPWCGPCKQLTPILEAAVRAAGGKIKLVKMNIDEHPAIPGQMGVQSIPAVIAFADGKPIDGIMGAKPESEIKAFIDKVIASGGGQAAQQEAAQIEAAMAAAAEAAQNGDLNGAAQIYSMVLQQQPDNGDAYGGMAALMVKAGQNEQAEAMLASAPETIAEHPALAGVRASLALAQKVAGLGDPQELEARLQANPDDHDARFDLAQILNAQERHDEAADHLLAIMQKDREWRDDGARQELITFFEAWGPTHAATLRARRKLSSLLFR